MFPCTRSVSSAFQLQHENRVTELSFRGYDVVAVSAYIASERDPEPSVRVGFAQGMNFASAERGDGWIGGGGIWEDGFTRRARFQVKLNMKLRDRSGSRGAFPSQEIQRIEPSMRPAS